MSPGSQGRRPSRLTREKKWGILGGPSGLWMPTFMPCRVPGDEISGWDPILFGGSVTT